MSERDDMLGRLVTALVNVPGEMLGALFDLITKLRSKEGANWFLNLILFLRKQNPWERLPTPGKLWRGLRLGVFETAQEIIVALKAGSLKVDTHAQRIMSEKAFSIIQGQMDADLIITSPSELGLTGGAVLNTLLEYAWRCGLEKCPPEIGPLARLAYQDQPQGEMLLVIMDTIKICDNTFACFALVNNTGLELQGWRSNSPNMFFRSNDKIIFIRRKN